MKAFTYITAIIVGLLTAAPAHACGSSSPSDGTGYVKHLLYNWYLSAHVIGGDVCELADRAEPMFSGKLRSAVSGANSLREATDQAFDAFYDASNAETKLKQSMKDIPAAYRKLAYQQALKALRQSQRENDTPEKRAKFQAIVVEPYVLGVAKNEKLARCTERYQPGGSTGGPAQPAPGVCQPSRDVASGEGAGDAEQRAAEANRAQEIITAALRETADSAVAESLSGVMNQVVLYFATEHLATCPGCGALSKMPVGKFARELAKYLKSAKGRSLIKSQIPFDILHDPKLYKDFAQGMAISLASKAVQNATFRLIKGSGGRAAAESAIKLAEMAVVTMANGTTGGLLTISQWTGKKLIEADKVWRQVASSGEHKKFEQLKELARRNAVKWREKLNAARAAGDIKRAKMYQGFIEGEMAVIDHIAKEQGTLSVWTLETMGGLYESMGCLREGGHLDTLASPRIPSRSKACEIVDRRG